MKTYYIQIIDGIVVGVSDIEGVLPNAITREYDHYPQEILGKAL